MSKLAMAGVSALLGLALAESILRLWSARDNVLTTATLNLYVSDPDLGWRMAPNLFRRVTWLGRSIVVRTDRDGHRVPEAAAAEAGTALVFAGDSYTFGNEVNAEETFAWKCGRSLGLAAVNLGVGSYSLDQECLSLERYLSRPDRSVRYAVLAVHVGNDIEYGARPMRTTHADADGYLVDSESSATFRNLVARSRVLFLAMKAGTLIESRLLPRGGETAPSYRWIYDENAWGPRSLDSHGRSLARLGAAARAVNVPLLVLLMPERRQVYGDLSDLPNRKFMALLDRLEIPGLDLLPPLRAQAGVDRNLYHWAPAGHLSYSGHDVVATRVSARLGMPPAGETARH
jgi:hypothetical protein